MVLVGMALCSMLQADLERIWLSHKSDDPSRIVVNWETDEPGDSIVEYGRTESYGLTVRGEDSVTLHHVEIPVPEAGVPWHYRVRTGSRLSKDAVWKGYPRTTLRVAVVANWQGRPDLSAIQADDVHLILTAGDNIANLHSPRAAKEGKATRAYSALVDRYRDLFRSVPVMPALGNHDKQTRPRGKKPPSDPVYDVEAAAFRSFFELPGEEWKWHFDVPAFDVRFVALDLNHISDLGTTWQSCHDYRKGSPQYEWYGTLMEETKRRFVVTLQNERNHSMRTQEGGAWHRMFRRGTLVVSGFGYFAERAEEDGFSYYNTSLNGKGDRYPDPRSKFLAGENTYLLLTFSRGAAEMTAEIKNLEGRTLHRRRHGGRP